MFAANNLPNKYKYCKHFYRFLYGIFGMKFEKFLFEQ